MLSPIGAGQPVRLAGRKARQDFGGTDLDIVAGHPPVRGKGQCQPAAECVTGDRGDRRLGNRGEGVDGLPTDLGGACGLLRVEGLTHRHIVACAEDLVPTEQDRRRDIVARTQFGCGGDDFTAHLAGQRVGRRPGQQQGGDAGMLVEGVNADELPHGVRPPSAWL